MPQGPAELHEKWGDDGAAIRHLESRGYMFTRGGIITAPPCHVASEEDQSALDYLFLEWDYAS